MDNEAKGYGAQYDYGFRIYDPRIGKFLSVDPLFKGFPWNSTYAYAEGDLIRSVDLDGLEKVIVNTVSFAPFDYFGADPWGTYTGNGNSRKFGDNLTSYVVNNMTFENWKIRSEVALDLATMQITSDPEAIGAWSHYLAYVPGPFDIPMRSSKSVYSNASFEGDFFSGQIGYTGPNIGLNYHLRGGNAAAPKVSSAFDDIDVNVDIFFWETDKANEIGIRGEVTGDRFPSNENYLTDEKGNILFLGVSGVNSESADNAPYTELPGNNKREMQSFRFTILFNDDNSFKGVRTSNGKEYSLSDWNKLFTNLNPQSSQTGTTVTSSTTDKNNFKGTKN